MAIDTLHLFRKLEQAGFERTQAETIVECVVEAQRELVTKTDLEMALTPLKTDLAVLKWMLAFVLGFVLSLVYKTWV